jgi:hypothetical protein
MSKYEHVPHMVSDLMRIATEAKNKQTAFLASKCITIDDVRALSEAELSGLNQEYSSFSV